MRLICACSTAGPPGTVTAIASESAVIVWDARTHTEHFIRRAAFNSNADNFGFLVPTPTQPKLAAADDKAFEMLEGAAQPRYVNRPVYGLALTSWLVEFSQSHTASSCSPGSTAAGEAPPPVEVLNVQRVAGYDAVVLKADDAAALTRWLWAHGYEARPALADWLKPYVRRHWAVTAFKIAKPDPNTPQVGSTAVRMSFNTPRPFFPYSEPADQRGARQYATSRLLRVFLMSNARMDGILDSATTRWPGYTRWATTLYTPPVATRQSRSLLTATLGLEQEQMPVPLWLTALEDRASPRPGVADLYFQPSAQQAPLAPPPIVVPVDEHIGVPIELVVFVLTLVVLRVISIRRRAGAGRA